LDDSAPGLPSLEELRYYLQDYLPGRIGEIGAGVRRWGTRQERFRYRVAFPLVVAGAFASWLGTWRELLNAAPARLWRAWEASFPGRRSREPGCPGAR
jgi:hypothetical protein